MKKNTIFQLAVFLLLLAVVSGIYTFVVIPGIRKDEKNKYDRMLMSMTGSYTDVLTYQGDTPLMAGTVISSSMSDLFTVSQIPPSMLSTSYVSDLSDIEGLQLAYTICKGQMVSYSNFKPYLLKGKGNERLKEFEIVSLIAGHAKAGCFVDIILPYPDGSYDVVVPYIQLYDIEADKGEQDLYTVVLAVNEEQYTDLNFASKIGKLDIRMYMDATQAPSAKTFSVS